MEIKESERRAHSQAEVLKNALDEHSLELRVKAANEAEAACQLRLSAAEAEIADLRAKLDSSERFVFKAKCFSLTISGLLLFFLLPFLEYSPLLLAAQVDLP